MPQLGDRIKNGLDEVRILMLGAQVLVGFEYRAVFEAGFEKLPAAAQVVKLTALGLLLIAVGLLSAPAAYHQIADRGKATPDLPACLSRMAALALLPFAAGFGGDMYVAISKIDGQAAAIAAGTVTALLALWFWYGLAFLHRATHGQKEKPMDEQTASEDPKKELKDKVEHALTEVRVVLPGAQALLGFQFAAMLVEGFDHLPQTSKYIHVVCLALMALSTILMMAPAAYHRIAERGEYSEHLHAFTSRMLLAAMVPLALGICGDFYVVLKKVTHSTALSLALSVAMLLFFFGLWFGYTLYRRAQQQPSVGGSPRPSIA
jgi:amino acid permease